MQIDSMLRAKGRLNPHHGSPGNLSAPTGIGFPEWSSSCWRKIFCSERGTRVRWERLKGRGQPTGQAPLDRKPTAEDFTGRAIQRAVLQDTLQHPATILPAALATVAALWSVAIALSPASLIATLGFGFISAAAWVINYIGRGDKLVEQHLQKLRALRNEYERREVEDMALACRQAGLAAGAKEAQELNEAYPKLN